MCCAVTQTCTSALLYTCCTAMTMMHTDHAVGGLLSLYTGVHQLSDAIIAVIVISRCMEWSQYGSISVITAASVQVHSREEGLMMYRKGK